MESHFVYILRQWHDNLKLRNSYFASKMSDFSKLNLLELDHMDQFVKQCATNFPVLRKFYTQL